MASTHRDDRAHPYDVAVIGCGAMGSAIARLLRRNDHAVAAWNRTPARAEALVPDGVVAVRTAVEAASSAPLVIACQTTYENTWASLRDVTAWAGATLVNLSAGTPAEAERMRRSTEERGGHYLDGVINCYPSELGEAGASIDVAGDSKVWSQHEAILRELGGVVGLISDDITMANRIQLGSIAFYIPALCAYVESATYLHSQGVSREVARSLALRAIDLLARHTDEIFAALQDADHSDEEASLDTYADATRLIREELVIAGLRAPVLEATAAALGAAQNAGLAELGISAQSILMRSDLTTTTTAASRGEPMSTEPVMNVPHDPALVEISGSIAIDRRAEATGLQHIGAGIAKWIDPAPSEPWTLPYEEAIYVIEGEITITAGGATVVGRAGDVITAEKGVEMVSSARPGTRVFFASYPGNWRDLVDA